MYTDVDAVYALQLSATCMTWLLKINDVMKRSEEAIRLFCGRWKILQVPHSFPQETRAILPSTEVALPTLCLKDWCRAVKQMILFSLPHASSNQVKNSALRLSNAMIYLVNWYNDARYVYPFTVSEELAGADTDDDCAIKMQRIFSAL